MRRAPTSAMLGPMPTSLTISWEPGRRPVSGEVTASAMSPRAFIGWLELLALLEEALATTDKEEP